jgi:hypothetical protein
MPALRGQRQCKHAMDHESPPRAATLPAWRWAAPGDRAAAGTDELGDGSAGLRPLGGVGTRRDGRFFDCRELFD